MQPLIRVPDPPNPPFTALNEARGFYPFDPIKLNWHATADPKDRAAPLANFGLGLKYTIKENQEHPLPVLVPASGTLSFLARESRTLVLEVDARALERLHVGGLDVKAARLLISFDAGQEDDLHAHLTALYTKGTLTRHWIEDQDLRVQKDAFTVVELPSATTEDQRRKQHLEPWWNGISAVPWSIKHVDQNTVLMELKKNESILIHAEVRGHASAPWHQEQGPDKWWRCNVGYFLGALGVAGDPHANDKIYRALSGDCRDLVSSSGDIPEKFEDVVVLYKGSRNSVVLQPAGPGTGSPIIPSALFSFSTADDIAIFAPTLEDTPLELECQQPTLNCWQMQQVKDQMTLRTGPKKKRNWYNKNNANRVYVPPFSSGLAAGVILASDYGKHAQANIKGKKKIPADRSKFFDAVDRVYDYSLSRSKFYTPRGATSAWINETTP
jgi:hypothetical protein